MSGGLGRSLPDVRVPPPGPRSRELGGRLREVESRNVTFVSDDFPVFWEEAAGANVRDVDGNVYVDLTGAFGVAAAGHGNPRVREALGRQADRLVHGMGDVHPPAAKLELLEALADAAPWPDARTVLATSGSEAVEVALKTALLSTGRPGILAFEGGYHGLTAGALAATARDDFRAPFDRRLYGGVALAPWPDAFRLGPGEALRRSVDAVEDALEAGAPGGDAIGAVIVEPVQGRAGVRIPPPGFLAGVTERAREAGAAVIFDEVFTGFGRTGALFAFEAEGAVPDVLCVGKALGGGLPVSACIAPAPVMDAWPESRGEALHTSTFLGHPLSMASAVAFLEELRGRGLVERSRRVGAEALEALRERLDGVPRVGEVRGRGLFVGIELVEDAGSRRPARGAGARVAAAALRRGVLVLPAGDQGHVVELAPPLTITREQMHAGIDAVAASVAAVVGAGASGREGTEP